jgi:hypothetical protein
VMTNSTLGDARPWRLGIRTRKGVLVVHIVSAGVWIGIDLVMAVVIFTALFTEDGRSATERLNCSRSGRCSWPAWSA